MALMHLEILTPDRVVFSGDVNDVNVQGGEGRLGILPRHTSLISTLKMGVLTYSQSTSQTNVLCGDGFLEVQDDRVSVLVHSAELENDIDLERAKQALERAKSRLNSKGPGLELQRAESALNRASQRLKFLNKL